MLIISTQQKKVIQKKTQYVNYGVINISTERKCQFILSKSSENWKVSLGELHETKTRKVTFKINYNSIRTCE